MGNVVNLLDTRNKKEESALALDFAHLIAEYILPQLSDSEYDEFAEAHANRDMKRVLAIAEPYIHRFRMELLNGR